MTWRPGTSRRSYLGVVPRRLSLACTECGAGIGHECYRIDAWGLKQTLKSTHKVRKPPRGKGKGKP